MYRIDIGVFAHNEEARIGDFLKDMARQSIFWMNNIDARLLVLANGCSDRTVDIACTKIERDLPFRVVEIYEPGKSRTWERFVHCEARPGIDILVFCDADIRLPEEGTLLALCNTLLARPELMVTSSRPIKDIVYAPEDITILDRTIAAAGGTLNDWRTAVCGQLYAARSEAVQSFHMPIGLPVEDGFVRAMILTQNFTAKEDVSRIDGDDTVYHIYESERGVFALIRHQTRIVVGSAINSVIYDHLTSSSSSESREEILKEAARNPNWLSDRLAEYLPSRKYGWIPFYFAKKRLTNSRRIDAKNSGLKNIAITTVGVIFDLVVYLRAQIVMATGRGAGYW